MKPVEFDGIRAELYEQAMVQYSYAREDDIAAMLKILEPRKGEKILGFGEGNGYFCSSIATAVGQEGVYLVTDPSKDQLDNLTKRVSLPQVKVKKIGIEGLTVDPYSFDKVWSFGAFHHCSNQTEAMKRIYGSLKDNGKMVICDVFQGSSLAKHFDEIVARYCVTGHEVKFLSDSFARTLCHLAGFDKSKVEIIDLPQKWKFRSENNLGEFIYKLHALTHLSEREEERIAKTLEGCYKILGIENRGGVYELNWPMKALIATK